MRWLKRVSQAIFHAFLQIRDLPEPLHRLLQRRALDRIQQRWQQRRPLDWSQSPEVLIREDRNR